MSIPTSRAGIQKLLRQRGPADLSAEYDRFLVSAGSVLSHDDFRRLLIRLAAVTQLLLDTYDAVAVPIPAFPKSQASGLPDLSAYAATPPPPASPMLPPLDGPDEGAAQ